eukprot:GHVT01075024.1.p2 GENE.GHVT01075024.1~~GHVT01075024.1.p2  ORF type:complete len:240 (-),score=29.59 GHVT01075024.1:594-1313(-)
MVSFGSKVVRSGGSGPRFVVVTLLVLLSIGSKAGYVQAHDDDDNVTLDITTAENPSYYTKNQVAGIGIGSSFLALGFIGAASVLAYRSGKWRQGRRVRKAVENDNVQFTLTGLTEKAIIMKEKKKEEKEAEKIAKAQAKEDKKSAENDKKEAKRAAKNKKGKAKEPLPPAQPQRGAPNWQPEQVPLQQWPGGDQMQGKPEMQPPQGSMPGFAPQPVGPPFLGAAPGFPQGNGNAARNAW